MGNYSIWITEESNISVSGGVTLDGVTQGDGSHLVGKTVTINSTASKEVKISDAGRESNFADNDRGQRLDGEQTIDGVTYSDNTRIEAEYQFVLRDDETGEEYRALAINVINSRVSYATNEGLAFVGSAPPAGVSLRVVSASEGPRNGGSGAVDASEIVPMCVCRATRIHTPGGLIPVENLRKGDRVLLADGSSARLRHVFCASLSKFDLLCYPGLRPVRISAGALGLGLPTRDLRVSRQHRMLVASKIAERMFGTQEVLVPACKLTALPGISVEEIIESVEYYHLLFDRHELIIAEGAPIESLFPGPEMKKTLSPQDYDAVANLIPEFSELGFTPNAVRYIPKGSEQKRLVERHIKNAQPVLQAV